MRNRYFYAVIAALLFISSQTCLAGSKELGQTLAKLKAVTGPYTFAVIGDNRSGDRVYKKVMYQMMRRKPMFVVSTGDIIPNPGNREQWANFKEVSRDITVSYFLAPGNHDIDDKKSEDVWREEVDLPGVETYYSFEVGPDLFIVLNSCEPKMDRRIAGHQLEWLKGVLKRPGHRRKFVFLHHPLFMVKRGKYYGESMDKYPEARNELHRLFLEGRVDAVFEGHVHTFSRMEVDGINYIITGGGGAPVYGKESYNHVVILKVDGERVEAKVIDREGMMRDEFVIRRGP